MNKILVVGATGATGRLLVENLLKRGLEVRAIVRSPDNLSEEIKNHKKLEIIRASLLDLSDAEMEKYTEGCHAVASCLGHNLSFRGIFGPPWRLVTDAMRRLSEAVISNQSDKHKQLEEPIEPKKLDKQEKSEKIDETKKTKTTEKPVKFILMNTTVNTNRGIQEKRSIGERIVVGIIRILLPPQADNEKAADYLRTEIGDDKDHIEWVVVRPDTLINEDRVTKYEVHSSPIRSAIFDPGRTSRINVGEFIAELIVDDELWDQWKGKMPVIYNTEVPAENPVVKPVGEAVTSSV